MRLAQIIAAPTENVKSPKSRRYVFCLLGAFAVMLLFSFAAYKHHDTAICYVQDGITADCRQRVSIRVSQPLRSLPYRMEDQQMVLTKEDGTISPLNSTLGFEKVYVLNLPHRRHRRWAMTLLLSHYKIAHEIIEGVDGRKEKPDLDLDKQRQHGRVEGHAKIWQKMLQDRISSALIFEDDMDFDQRIHQQMAALQEPLAAMLNIVHGGENSTQISIHDAWNSKLWDLLWLGHCSEEPWKSSNIPTKTATSLTGMPFLSYRDDTVLDAVLAEKGPHAKVFAGYQVPSDVRLIQPTRDAQCLSAYGLTRIGAARALYQNAHKNWLT